MQNGTERMEPGRRGALRAVCGWLLLLAGPAFCVARAQTPPACNAADPDQVRLQVSVSGMRSANGLLSITIYPDDAEHFLDGKYKLARQTVPVTLPVTSACFVVGAPGWYAVALFHDENSNGHLDTNLLGIPTEGYGFSGNPTIYLGPPGLDRVRFEAHAGDNPVPVRMKY
jgi:uncharacterized protein (DUF2141 family)